MHIPVFTRQFEKDLRRAERRGKNIDKFKTIAKALLAGERLG
jgi:mRNA interferase YafQ